MNINVQKKKKFTSLADFTEWKSSFETSTGSKYVKNCGAKGKSDNQTTEYYYCNRTGPFGQGLRRNKAQGSLRGGIHCTSSMKVEIQNEEHVTVQYYPAHYGHSNLPASEELNMSDNSMTITGANIHHHHQQQQQQQQENSQHGGDRSSSSSPGSSSTSPSGGSNSNSNHPPLMTERQSITTTNSFLKNMNNNTNINININNNNNNSNENNNKKNVDNNTSLPMTTSDELTAILAVDQLNEIEITPNSNNDDHSKPLNTAGESQIMLSDENSDKSFLQVLANKTMHMDLRTSDITFDSVKTQKMAHLLETNTDDTISASESQQEK